MNNVKVIAKKKGFKHKMKTKHSGLYSNEIIVSLAIMIKHVAFCDHKMMFGKRDPTDYVVLGERDHAIFF